MDQSTRRRTMLIVAVLLIPVLAAAGWLSGDLDGLIEVLVAFFAIGGVVTATAVFAWLGVRDRREMASDTALKVALGSAAVFSVPALAGFLTREVRIQQTLGEIHEDLCEVLNGSPLGPCDEAISLLPPLADLLLGMAVVVMAVLAVAMLMTTLTRFAQRQPAGIPPVSDVPGDDAPTVEDPQER